MNAQAHESAAGAGELPERPTAGGRWGRGISVLAILGATVGAALDGIHTHTGTLHYPETVFFRMAWWVPFLFSAAALAIGLARPAWERILDRRTAAPPWPIVALGMALFILSYALSGVLPWAWSSVALVLAILFGATWAACDRTGLGIFLAVSTALLGTSVEIMLVRMEAFAYFHPDLAGVPGWLPWLYTTAAIAVGNLGKWLVDPPFPPPDGRPAPRRH